jgi:hypothetical protein
MFKGHLVKIEHTARICIHCVCCVWEGGVGVWKSVCGIEFSYRIGVPVYGSRATMPRCTAMQVERLHNDGSRATMPWCTAMRLNRLHNDGFKLGRLSREFAFLEVEHGVGRHDEVMGRDHRGSVVHDDIVPIGSRGRDIVDKGLVQTITRFAGRASAAAGVGSQSHTENSFSMFSANSNATAPVRAAVQHRLRRCST